ncbi:MAG: cyclic lactone autoinducer peptide [Clostridioides difficile]|nr:cyclic lactone autoinducer peptide [Clostridioides sp.]MBS5787547.1 cyclic lactone autoinducer peptide [Clostridioides difficile]
MNKQFLKIMKHLSKLALGISVLSANTTSWWNAYQPEMDDDIKKLKKL